MIVRDKLHSVNHLLKEYQYLFVLGDFGNGKSVFLEEIMIKLTSENKEVFYLKDFNADYILDLEKINNLEKDIYIVIDGYAQCLDIFKFIADNKLDNLKFIFSERTPVHNGLKHDLEIVPKSVDISIDKLINDEIEFFIDIVDNIGYWGDKSKLSLQNKKKMIRKNNEELSLNLLSLFDSNHIKGKLQSLVSSIDKKDYIDTFFAICLLETIGVELNQSLISEVALNNAIFENNFKNHTAISQIFRFNGNDLVSKSSLFSLYLLKNTFFAKYMIDRLVLLSRRFNEIQDDNYINKEISKYLLRFNFLQRILPGTDEEQNNNLVQYYEKLKTAMPWLKKDIHYWLQYGMCNMALGKYDTAQKYLDNAYSFASGRDSYDTVYIDSQQSRLYLIQALEIQIPQKAFEKFQDAHSLIALPEDGYKYKRVISYYKIYEKHYKLFSKEYRRIFIEACENMLYNLKSIHRELHYENYSANRIYDSCQKQLEKILENES